MTREHRASMERAISEADSLPRALPARMVRSSTASGCRGPSHERLDLVEVARRGLVHGVSLPVHPEEADPALVVLVEAARVGGGALPTWRRKRATPRGDAEGKSERAGLERRRDERARGQTKSGDDDRPARTGRGARGGVHAPGPDR